MALKFSKYFITLGFVFFALVSVWFNFNKVKTITENLVTPPLETTEKIVTDILEQEVIKKDEPQAEVVKDTNIQKDEKKLESFVLDFLSIDDHINIAQQAILRSDYEKAASIRKNLKLSSSNFKELDNILKDFELLKITSSKNIFPGDSRFLVWVKSIFTVNLIQDTKATQKKKDLLDRLESIRTKASNDLKHNIKP